MDRTQRHTGADIGDPALTARGMEGVGAASGRGATPPESRGPVPEAGDAVATRDDALSFRQARNLGWLLAGYAGFLLPGMVALYALVGAHSLGPAGETARVVAAAAGIPVPLEDYLTLGSGLGLTALANAVLLLAAILLPWRPVASRRLLWLALGLVATAFVATPLRRLAGEAMWVTASALASMGVAADRGETALAAGIMAAVMVWTPALVVVHILRIAIRLRPIRRGPLA